MKTAAYRYVQMTLFDAMQADHYWELPDGSADRPFIQKYLTDCMCSRRKRLAMWQQKSAEECRIDFAMAQAEKIRVGKDLHCSEGLARQIRRLVLEEDLDL